jgi:phosphohistidine phosphatase
MASRDEAPPAAFTTNEEDQRAADLIKARLRGTAQRDDRNKPTSKVASVQIADGSHKYVLIQAEQDGATHYFVTSRRGASYHRNAAEPLIAELEAAGYYDIEVTGGGRIFLDEDKKKISIFGFSYSFGLANHSISREVVLEDPRYKGFDVTISDEGY